MGSTDQLVYSFILNQKKLYFIPNSYLYNLVLKIISREGCFSQANNFWDLLLVDFNYYCSQLAETFVPSLWPKMSKYFYLQLRKFEEKNLNASPRLHTSFFFKLVIQWHFPFSQAYRISIILGELSAIRIKSRGEHSF